MRSAHEVGARLRAFREFTNVSQERAAAAVREEHGSSSVLATYRRWETTGKITAPELLSAATALGCDPCWLLTGQGEAPADPDGRLAAKLAEYLPIDQGSGHREDADAGPLRSGEAGATLDAARARRSGRDRQTRRATDHGQRQDGGKSS